MMKPDEADAPITDVQREALNRFADEIESTIVPLIARARAVQTVREGRQVLKELGTAADHMLSKP